MNIRDLTKDRYVIAVELSNGSAFYLTNSFRFKDNIQVQAHGQRVDLVPMNGEVIQTRNYREALRELLDFGDFLTEYTGWKSRYSCDTPLFERLVIEYIMPEPEYYGEAKREMFSLSSALFDGIFDYYDMLNLIDAEIEKQRGKDDPHAEIPQMEKLPYEQD